MKKYGTGIHKVHGIRQGIGSKARNEISRWESGEVLVAVGGADGELSFTPTYNATAILTLIFRWVLKSHYVF